MRNRQFTPVRLRRARTRPPWFALLLAMGVSVAIIVSGYGHRGSTVSNTAHTAGVTKAAVARPSAHPLPEQSVHAAVDGVEVTRSPAATTIHPGAASDSVISGRASLLLVGIGGIALLLTGICALLLMGYRRPEPNERF